MARHAAASVPRTLAWPKRLAIIVACVVGYVLGTSAAALAATPWGGSGTGSTNVASDGSSAPAQFTYNWNDPCSCGTSGNWSFSTTSDVSGTVSLSWTYTGFNAWYDVTAGLNAFVTHLGTTTTTPLVSAGPANCCSSPSGGFSYSGSTSLTVAVGDSYGFTMSGSNYDSDSTLNGTFTVTVSEPSLPDPPPPPLAQRAGYCAAAGDVDPVSGQPIPAGTFLNLNKGQPDSDPNYAGATPARYVEGEGITCDAPPPGDVQDGFEAGYPSFGPPSPPERTGYCTAAGDVNPLSGQPIPAGTFVDLLTNQPASDPDYAGATPAIYIQGQGVTCGVVPAGYQQNGFYGLNPSYVRSA